MVLPLGDMEESTLMPEPGGVSKLLAFERCELCAFSESKDELMGSCCLDTASDALSFDLVWVLEDVKFDGEAAIPFSLVLWDTSELFCPLRPGGLDGALLFLGRSTDTATYKASWCFKRVAKTCDQFSQADLPQNSIQIAGHGTTSRVRFVKPIAGKWHIMLDHPWSLFEWQFGQFWVWSSPLILPGRFSSVWHQTARALWEPLIIEDCSQKHNFDSKEGRSPRPRPKGLSARLVWHETLLTNMKKALLIQILGVCLKPSRRSADRVTDPSTLWIFASVTQGMQTGAWNICTVCNRLRCQPSSCAIKSDEMAGCK